MLAESYDEDTWTKKSDRQHFTKWMLR